MKRNFILLALVTLISFETSAQDLNSYKEKLLDMLASKMKTTKEMMIEDLELKVDSLSLAYFTVDDSINMIVANYDKEIKKQEELIEYNKGLIESANKKEVGSNPLIAISERAAKESVISGSTKKIERCKREIERLEKKCEAEVGKYANRSKTEVLFDAFRCRLIMKNPRTKMRKVLVGYTFFTPGGEKIAMSQNTGKMENYMEEKRTKK